MAPRFFSEDGRQMFVSVGSASDDGEGMGKRDAAAIARWEPHERKMQCGKPSLGAAQDVAPMRWRGPGTLLCTLMCT
jgi:hypothetical protein